MSDVEGRVAVVTGASSGLGAHFARVLRGAGASVVLAARRTDRLRALVAELGPDATAYHAGDLRDDSQVDAVVNLALDRFGRIDILVANAGAAYEAPAEQEPMAQLRELVDLNLTSVLSLCRAAGPTMLAARAGSVILVSSMFGLIGVDQEGAGMAGYVATKGALVSLARELARQWGPYGVRVNALAPGFFPTEMTGHLASVSQVDRIRRRTLLGRPGDLPELAGPLLFLASDASSYVTGQTLVVDGGWTAH
jgi:NAD(P)-dependent dehydrogenase (short-subunit alcohol dehydrogenase family)